MVPTRKNTLIRTSFEELKTSICWLKLIIQVENHRKKMSVWREIDQKHTDIANNYSEENNSWLSMELNQNNNEGLFRWELQQRGTVPMRTSTMRDCSDENANWHNYNQADEESQIIRSMELSIVWNSITRGYGILTEGGSDVRVHVEPNMFWTNVCEENMDTTLLNISEKDNGQ